MSSYFTLPSFARAKQNKEQLEKTNPQNPVLKDEDEKFLKQQIESKEAPPPLKQEAPTKITDDGKEQPASPEEKKKTGADGDQVILPDTEHQEAAKAAAQEDVEDPPEQVPDDTTTRTATAENKAKKSKKNKGFELPSQEEAEAATRGFNVGGSDKPQESQHQGEQRTWASYLPTLSSGKKEQSSEHKPNNSKDEASDDKSQGRTWQEYASETYSSLPTLPTLPTFKFPSKDKDSKLEPVYNEDGTINEAETQKKQEREVSVLLDHLNLSSINNRVFAFSSETQKIYERFAQVLKDTMAGAPTAYEDMEKLMREAGPQLEKQFESMPPFVQTLVKSLPAKLGGTLGPELLAAASEKPGADMKARMEAASKKSNADPSIQPSEGSSKEKSSDANQKKKRTIPGLKGLVSQQGAVAGILRNVVTFLQTRFPFLASTTNVVMSLAVFILMFVFWYCHKRGKEVRLAKEAAAAGAAEKEGEAGKRAANEEDDEEEEIEVTDEEPGDEVEEQEVEVAEEKGGVQSAAAESVTAGEKAGEVKDFGAART